MNTLNNKIRLNLDGDVKVSVKGSIAPIEHTLSNFHVEWETLANLRVTEPEKQYSASVFQSFLPTKPISVGECWQIQESGVLALLRQLHTALNLNMDVDSENSDRPWACLRAYNDRFADIVFRVHAAFKLEDGWLTPSQFAGNLVIDRLAGNLVFFEMSVPAGTVNLDIGWKEDKEASYSITDAGFCSQMQLRAGARDVVQSIEFSTSITQEAAERTLAGCFYKSEQINWVSPYQAVEMAETQVKLIHAISIDGPLADESC